MKKVISLFIAVAMLLCFAACNADTNTEGTKPGALTPMTSASESTTASASTSASTTAPKNPENPASLSQSDKTAAAKRVQEAVKAFFKNNSMHAEINAELNMSSAGITSTNAFFKELYADSLGSSPVFKSISSSTVGGETQTSETYFKGGVYYVSKYGFDAKIPQSQEADEAYGWKKTFEPFVVGFDADKYINYYLVNDDGSCKIKANTQQKHVHFTEIEDMFKESFGAPEEGTNVTYGAPKESMVIVIDKDGNLKSYSSDVSMDITVSAEGKSQAVVITMKTEVTVENAGKAVDVEAPEKSLDSFTETTEKAFGYTFAKMAYDKFMQEPDLDASLNCNIQTQMGSIEVETRISGTMQAKDYRSETPVIRQRVATIIGNSQMKSDIYFKDGYYYINSMSDTQDIHQKLSKDEYTALYGEDDGIDFPFISEAHGVNYDIVHDTKTGERTIYFELSSLAALTTFADHIESMKSLIVGEMEIASSSVTNAMLIINLSKDGELKDYAIAYELNITVNQGSQSIATKSYIYDMTTIKSTRNVSVQEIPNIDSYTGSSATA
jgi:hypothetical protein